MYIFYFRNLSNVSMSHNHISSAASALTLYEDVHFTFTCGSFPHGNFEQLPQIFCSVCFGEVGDDLTILNVDIHSTYKLV